ncbi:TIM-barrel domain-containing protein [Brumicola blandensis]|uniref:Glycoside hydrolase family 31 protein n=1 Tax=Brumicola blandensis TaxID=3075611 RepID=A0AAW8QXL7_9ALTE|nr:TIM-barrel domain-containing protein [Alteromonas sp. W409]MDT0581687.1 glycoside hydrolase family 31 protein [Alteromonas sp. W409]
MRATIINPFYTSVKSVCFTFCLLVLLAPLNAAELLSTEKRAQALHISSEKIELTITALNDSTFEVSYEADGVKQLPSFALSEEVKQRDLIVTELSQNEKAFTFSAKNISAVINKDSLGVSFYRDGKLLVSEEAGFFAHDTLRGFRFALQDDEKLMGGGQRVLGMDRRGHRMPLYNRAHYGYTTESSQMYYSLPAVMSTNMYAIGFDNSASGFLDIGHTESDVLQFEAVGGRTSYIISSGETYAEIVKNFVDVTGKQPLPPRWALGNYASRFGYKSQKQTLETVEQFRKDDIPLDAVVLDLYWFGPDIKGHMGNLQWDKNTFPQPEKMIKTLKKNGVKTILITEPFILSTSTQWDSAVENDALARSLGGGPRRFDFYFGNTGLVDVFDEAAQDWFWDFYAALDQQGVAGWWGDLGEPEVHPGDSIHHFNGDKVTGDEIHNVYGHQWAKMVYERQTKLTPNERPFIMMRSGFLGTQRYGIIPWTGDVSREWGGLKPQVELSLQMSMFGLAYTHSDLGGFAGGEVFDPELYIRWMQYGVFQPVYRPHAQDNIAPEPVFHDQATKDIVREFVKLRYRLLPYNYSLSFENSLSGLPMMRPTFLHSASSDIENSTSYFWGDAFLVQPITDPGVTNVKMKLPPGVWFNFWNDSRYKNLSDDQETPLEIEVSVSLKELPVLVKAGSFIPMAKDIQSTEAYDPSDLTVHYYHDPSVTQTTYTMYDDDGQSADSIKQANYQTIDFQAMSSDAGLQLDTQVKGSFADAPKSRDITFVVHGVNEIVSEVLVNGSAVKVLDAKAFVKSHQAAYWNEKTQQLRVKARLESRLELLIK